MGLQKETISFLITCRPLLKEFDMSMVQRERDHVFCSPCGSMI